MTVLVPGLHLLDAETYACAGLIAASKRLGEVDAFDDELAELLKGAYVGRHRTS